MTLAQATNQGLGDVFGQITPAGPAALNNANGLSTLIVTGIRLFFIVAGLTLLFYLLWGAYEWITSGGDKDGIADAQAKIRNAVIGMILTVVALSIFLVVSGDILGIIKRGPDGSWTFSLPTLNSQ